MSLFIRRMLGHFPQNESPIDGAPSGTATTPVSGAEPAPSPAAAPAAAPEPDAATPPASEPAAEPSAPAVPEKYEFANLPEGYQLDAAATEQWSGVFKELGLTQEQAQKLVEMDATRQNQGQAAAEEQRVKTVTEWETALRNDKDFGGAKFEENVGIAQKALADFGTPELKQMLVDSGLGSHPEIVRFFHNVGKELGEGKLHRSTTEQPAERSLAERMYPNHS